MADKQESPLIFVGKRVGRRRGFGVNRQFSHSSSEQGTCVWDHASRQSHVDGHDLRRQL